MSPEVQQLLRKRVAAAFDAAGFHPVGLAPLEPAVFRFSIDRIVADDRLRALFAGIDDDETLCRTFLSVYFRTLYRTP